MLGSVRLIILECVCRENTVSMFQEFYDAGAEGYGVIVIWECETKQGEAELHERLRLAFQALSSPPA